MLIIFTGNGKGKTTAALGQALRALGNGGRVLMVQFIKGPWKSGEDETAKKLSPYFKIEKRGKGFVNIGLDKIPFQEHVQAAHSALLYADEEARSGNWDILILDEVWNALDLKLVTEKMVSDFIAENAAHIDHLIMTGRNCPQSFIEQADLVTEMREVKHPFNSKVKGQKNVEF